MSYLKISVLWVRLHPVVLVFTRPFNILTSLHLWFVL